MSTAAISFFQQNVIQATLAAAAILLGDQHRGKSRAARPRYAPWSMVTHAIGKFHPSQSLCTIGLISRWAKSRARFLQCGLLGRQC